MTVIRSTVAGGGASAFMLAPGDRLGITDIEGLQAAELFLADPEAEDLSPDATRGMAAWRVLDGTGQAGARFDWPADRALQVIIAAPGGPMAPDAQNPPTDLQVEITRLSETQLPLPAPLAPPLLDLRIAAATAKAFTVRAGDYIQIIDVEGKQCSDFLAFEAADLAHGIEKGLDPTVTRTLMGAAYPGPGLHSRYYDADMRPLVEIVQDTVGRHDTFALACTAKYYEDAGYPGHANCSDNFNAALAPYGVGARKGWPAINFFYNTQVDAHNQLTMDEPWSRPGDYVLLRALTDLVCATSSCADDIDPANGWTPTDIHVRIYDRSAAFSKGSAYRMTPDAEPRLTRETGFHGRISALTRSFTDYRGFWLPTSFPGYGAIAEYWACREAAVVMDLSALRKFEITGPDAEQLLQRCTTRNIAKLAIGQVVYTALVYDHGGMIDDGTIMRLGAANFRLIVGEDATGLWLRQKAEEWGLQAWVRSSTDQLHNLAVQGPNSRSILAEVVWTPPHHPSLAELKWFRFTIGRMGGPLGAPVVISRTGYTGELGYEVWCHPKDAEAVWDAIWQSGQAHGLTPLGFDALEMLRIEAGLVFADFDFSDQTDPFEAGIGFTVAEKDGDYVGREALLRRRATPARKLVGLTLAGDEPASHGDPVLVGRAQIGVVTSATRSPILGQCIALARLDVAQSALGQAVEIGKLDGHQKRLAATIVPFPHYDPQKLRVRS
jgi:aminomethyltransferase